MTTVELPSATLTYPPDITSLRVLPPDLKSQITNQTISLVDAIRVTASAMMTSEADTNDVNTHLDAISSEIDLNLTRDNNLWQVNHTLGGSSQLEEYMVEELTEPRSLNYSVPPISLNADTQAIVYYESKIPGLFIKKEIPQHDDKNPDRRPTYRLVGRHYLSVNDKQELGLLPVDEDMDQIPDVTRDLPSMEIFKAWQNTLTDAGLKSPENKKRAREDIRRGFSWIKYDFDKLPDNYRKNLIMLKIEVNLPLSEAETAWAQSKNIPLPNQGETNS